MKPLENVPNFEAVPLDGVLMRHPRFHVPCPSAQPAAPANFTVACVSSCFQTEASRKAVRLEIEFNGGVDARPRCKPGGSEDMIMLSCELDIISDQDFVGRPLQQSSKPVWSISRYLPVVISQRERGICQKRTVRIKVNEIPIIFKGSDDP